MLGTLELQCNIARKLKSYSKNIATCVKDNNGSTGQDNGSTLTSLMQSWAIRPDIRPPVVLDTLADEESTVVECAEENAQEWVSVKKLQDGSDGDFPLSSSSVPSSEASEETVDYNEEENGEMQQRQEEKKRREIL